MKRSTRKFKSRSNALSINSRICDFESSFALKALGKEFMVLKLEDEIESIKTDVERLSSRIERLRQRRAHASVNAKMPRSEPFPILRKRMRLWERLHVADGIVDRETFYRLAEKVGYDRKMLGGFFKGKGSLVWIDDDKVGLRAWAAREVEDYWGRIRGGNATRTHLEGPLPSFGKLTRIVPRWLLRKKP